MYSAFSISMFGLFVVVAFAGDLLYNTYMTEDKDILSRSRIAAALIMLLLLIILSNAAAEDDYKAEVMVKVTNSFLYSLRRIAALLLCPSSQFISAADATTANADAAAAAAADATAADAAAAEDN